MIASPQCLATLFTLDPLIERRIIIHDGSNPCWEWTGASVKSKRRPRARYGMVKRRRVAHRPLLAHRYVYVLLVGSIPEGFEVHHRCKNTLCVNPAHLEALSEEEHDWAEREAAHYDDAWSADALRPAATGGER
ncbi:MAG TPA: HNH endonuclease signature motif containing protein [Longimicrobium sp.]|nr:HNH endonuclease signature motif containing protein [Longimicrobium sp.]